MAQAYSDGALIWATIFAIMFGAIRAASSSGISWLRSAFAAYAPLEYPFIAIAVFLGVYGWTGRPRFAMLLAFVVAVGYFVIATGAGF